MSLLLLKGSEACVPRSIEILSILQIEKAKKTNVNRVYEPFVVVLREVKYTKKKTLETIFIGGLNVLYVTKDCFFFLLLLVVSSRLSTDDLL